LWISRPVMAIVAICPPRRGAGLKKY